MKKIFLILTLLQTTVALSQTAKRLVNRAQDQDLCLQVNDGGVPGDGLCVDGATKVAKAPNGLSVGGNETISVYDESSFTPFVAGSSTNPTGVTYNQQVGTVTRIGDTIFLRISLNWTAATAGTGVVFINIPTPHPVTNTACAGALNNWNHDASAVQILPIAVTGGRIDFYHTFDNATITGVDAAGMNATGEILITCNYKV